MTPSSSVAPSITLPPARPPYTSTPVKGQPPDLQPPTTPRTPQGSHVVPAFATPIAAGGLDESQSDFVTPDLERSHLDALATSMRSAAAFQGPPSK